MTSRRKNRRVGKSFAPEVLEQRTLLTTAGSTLTEILFAQTDDSGAIQRFVDSGDIGESNGANLQVRYDRYLEAASEGRIGVAANRLQSFQDRVDFFVSNDRITQDTADRLNSLIQFDGNHGDYDILREAVVATGNTALLDRFSAAFTVFAPTDRAFINLAENLGGDGSTEAAAFASIVDIAADLGNGDPIPVLNTILEQHIVRGQRDQQWLRRTDYNVGDTVEFNDQRFVTTVAHRSGQQFASGNFERLSGRSDANQQSLSFSQVVRAAEIETFGGGTITPDGRFLLDVDRDLPDARLNKSRSDIPAKNGVIHTINEVMIPIDLLVPPTITGTILENAGEFDNTASDFDILLNAIQAVDNSADDDTNLADVLNDPDADLTVFTPTDNAFRRLATDLGVSLDPTDTDGDGVPDDEDGDGRADDMRTVDERAFDGLVEVFAEMGGGDPIPVLRSILTYHVSAGEQSLSEIVDSNSLNTVNGSTISPSGRTLRDQDPEVTDPRIVKSRSDVLAENGVVHTIDRVLLPNDLATADTFGDVLAASGGEFDSDRGDFDILARAVETAGLGDTLSDPDQSLTVFAPTDNAFIVLAQELGFEGIDETGAFNTIVDVLTELGNGDAGPLLNDILLYHIANGERKLAGLDGETVSTLSGETFEVQSRLIDNDPDITNGTISEDRSDVDLENGIMHVISRVLLPFDV